MRLEYNLELRQTQKLLMTPQLRQAIKLLQLPALELSEYLDQQYLENPMLEMEDPEEEVVNHEDESFDIDWEQYFQDQGDLGEPVSRQDTQRPTFESFTGSEATFHQRLLQQLGYYNLSPAQQRIAAYIIDNLDDNGYLPANCTDIAERLGVSTDAVYRALAVVQSLEPAGIGARDLRECLLLQLRQCTAVPPFAWQIVCRHLDLVARGKVPVLAEMLGASAKEVQAAIDFIKSLDPKPGQSVGERRASYIYPDVTVLDVAGEWVILVNESQFPRLCLNPFYHRLLQAAETEETKKFLREKFNSALWLLKAVEQRRTTLQRITEFIIDYQRDFFRQGVKHLRPLRLRDVAEALNIHESTVSRAVNGKYVQTPRGTYELKYFFSVNLDTADGSGMSSTGVKQLLQELVAGEDRTMPLTDQQLAQKLREQGVQISRRTVAKYREELGIPSSTLRKRWE